MFGATGRVGSSLLQYALADKHQVSAFVRDKTKIKLLDPALSVFEGDIYRPESVSEIVGQGFEAIFNVIGTDPLKPSTVVTDSARSIVGAMEQAGVSRYLAITGTAQMPTANIGGRLSDWILRRTPVGNAATDHDGAFEIVKVSKLDWTLAGCPYIKAGQHTGKYRLSNTFREASILFRRRM